MVVDLFAEGSWNEPKHELQFALGVSTYPLPLQSVYLMTNDETRELYRAAEDVRTDGEDPLIDLGAYVGAEGTVVRANVDRMLSQHCAVLGSTGSGKSAAVSALVHSILERNSERGTPWRPNIVIIDPHGEYGAAFQSRATVYRAYDLVGESGGEGAIGNGTALRLPYWLMSGNEFRSLVIGKTEEEATSQNNIVYKALAHARLVHLGLIEPAKDWTKNQELTSAEPDAPRPMKGVDDGIIASFNRDLPIPFELREFENHIKWEQGVALKSGAWQPKSATDFKSHRSILDKLNVLRTDPRVRFMMREYSVQETLENVVAQFVGEADGNREADVRVVDISGLPNEVAGPLTAAISRLLFQYKLWQTRAEREHDPILLICEEAHRYVPNHGSAEYEAAQDAVVTIEQTGPM